MSASQKEVLDGCHKYAPADPDTPGPVVTFRYKAAEGDNANRAEDRTVRILGPVWVARSTGKPMVSVVHVDANGAPVIEEVERKDKETGQTYKVEQEATRSYRIERITTAPVPVE